MKILHIDISGPYTVGATYQENLLPGEHVKLGLDVVIWGSPYTFRDGKIEYVGKERLQLDDGVVLQRVEYKRIINEYFTEKIRACRDAYNMLEAEKPDIIMIHCPQTAVVLDVCKYVTCHDGVKLICDSHAEYLNSAKNLFSKLVLHKGIYKFYMKKAYKYSKKLYCISPEVMTFNKEIYNLPDKKMKLLPLGGLILDDSVYTEFRRRRREELGISESYFSINIVHSGKLVSEKRTIDLLEAFHRVKSKMLHLTIIGSAEGRVLKAIEENANLDNRISWLGWKSGEELTQYLCSGDVYILPGDVSATVQNAMCCRCGIIVYPYDIYRVMEQDEICYVKTVDELEQSLRKLIDNEGLIKKIRKEAYVYAKDKLDYAAQAKMILQED